LKDISFWGISTGQANTPIARILISVKEAYSLNRDAPSCGEIANNRDYISWTDWYEFYFFNGHMLG